MRATTVMLLAIGALILAHWANNKKTVNPKMVIELTFALIVIAALDQGKTEPVAKGFSWLFLVAVLLSNESILTSLAKSTGQGAGTVPAPPSLVRQAPGPAVPLTPVPQAPPGYGYSYTS
jgi:hypothetical protein